MLCEVLGRVQRIRWACEDPSRFSVSRVALMAEHLRRAAIWARDLGCEPEWPFFDVAKHAAALDVRADYRLPDAAVSALPAAVRDLLASMLRFEALRAPPRPDLPHPYEPLLCLLERGGTFRIDGRVIDVGSGHVLGVEMGPYLEREPLVALDAYALDALDGIETPDAPDLSAKPTTWPLLLADRARVLAVARAQLAESLEHAGSCEEEEDRADTISSLILPGCEDHAAILLLEGPEAWAIATRADAALREEALAHLSGAPLHPLHAAWALSHAAVAECAGAPGLAVDADAWLAQIAEAAAEVSHGWMTARMSLLAMIRGASEPLVERLLDRASVRVDGKGALARAFAEAAGAHLHRGEPRAAVHAAFVALVAGFPKAFSDGEETFVDLLLAARVLQARLEGKVDPVGAVDELRARISR